MARRRKLQLTGCVVYGLGIVSGALIEHWWHWLILIPASITMGIILATLPGS